jgi:hypothetical protein
MQQCLADLTVLVFLLFIFGKKTNCKIVWQTWLFSSFMFSQFRPTATSQLKVARSEILLDSRFNPFLQFLEHSKLRCSNRLCRRPSRCQRPCRCQRQLPSGCARPELWVKQVERVVEVKKVFFCLKVHFILRHLIAFWPLLAKYFPFFVIVFQTYFLLAIV